MEPPHSFLFSSFTTKYNATEVAPSDYLNDLLEEDKPLRSDNANVFPLSGDEIDDILSDSYNDLGQTEIVTITETLPDLVEQATSVYTNQSNDPTRNSHEYIDFFNELPENQMEREWFNEEFISGLEKNIHLPETNTMNNQCDFTDRAGVDTVSSNSDEINDSVDERIDDLDQPQMQMQMQQLTQELSRILIHSSEESTSNNLNQAKVNTLVKADYIIRSNLINSIYGIQTNQTLAFCSKPLACQRAVYKSDLEKDLRFVSTQDENYIKFEMFVLPPNLISMKILMRITRITTQYGPDKLFFCHPYPLWTTDKDAKVHHGSLLLDITNSIRNNQQISFKNLIMGRLGQSPLKKITQWPIYTPNQLDCNDSHTLKTNKPKKIIEDYNLRYSILIFQIFLVDDDHVAYPTDLICQSESLFEFEHKDRPNLPDFLPPQRKRPLKRLQ